MMEYCDLYDRDGQPTGQVIVRGDAIPERCYRMIAGVLCVHTDGSILLMKRHPSKRTHPGLFEASASGSVMAGETAQAAAVRELREETGIHCKQVQPLYQEAGDGRLYRGFLAQVDCDKQSVRLQPGETVDYRWVNRSELMDLLQRKPSPVIIHPAILDFLGLQQKTNAAGL